MAVEYAKVLQAMGVPFQTVGRGASSAEAFRQKTGASVIEGGLSSYLKKTKTRPAAAIVCTGIEALADATIQLIRHNVRHILVEKPGGLNTSELIQVKKESGKHIARVFIAYNRRFYASVQKAREWIEADGGLQSFHFEFTERSQAVATSSLPETVKQNWLLANSSHVIDLAFYLGGFPSRLHTFSSGSLPWHPSAAQFAGAGKTERGALFSYHADWAAPGRWSIDLRTAKRRLLLCPLEKLKVQWPGQDDWTSVLLSDERDRQFKPGLYRLTASFLFKEEDLLPKIDEHCQSCQTIYTKMVPPLRKEGNP